MKRKRSIQTKTIGGTDSVASMASVDERSCAGAKRREEEEEEEEEMWQDHGLNFPTTKGF
jgi:hypothetical protein